MRYTDEEHGEALDSIDDWIEEYLTLSRSSLQLNVEECCAKHPNIADEIRQIFPIISLLETVSSKENLSTVETIVHDYAGAERAELEPPCHFGRYQLKSVLGCGAMGTVYLAHDEDLNRIVAIKLPKFSDTNRNAAKRFRREAQSMAMVEHENLCTIYDVGQIDGRDYLSITFIDGESLQQLLQRCGPLEPEAATSLVFRLCGALSALHEKGVLHRDIKPGNIMLCKDGNPILMDLGLASLPSHIETELTREGEIVGSPAYLSPEQIESEIGEIGPPSDIYALGVVLFELLTGQRPFQGSVLRVLREVATTNPPKPSSIQPRVPEQLDKICLRALSRDPAKRFRSAGEFAELLEEYLKGLQTKRKIPGFLTVTLVALLSTVASFSIPAFLTWIAPKNNTTPGTEEVAKSEDQWPPANPDQFASSGYLPPVCTPSNTSSGEFVDSEQRLGDTESCCVQLGDLDADGDLDAFVGSGLYQPDRVWINDGSANFTDQGQRLGENSTATVALGDIDRDGDLDAISGSQAHDTDADLWINSGRGLFKKRECSIGRAYHVVLSDFDQDGDLDAFAAKLRAPNKIYKNDGGGNFIDSGQILGGYNSVFAIADDFNGDDKIDVYVCNRQSDPDKLYINDGSAVFSEKSQTLPRGESICARSSDWDSDGDQDVLVALQDGYLQLLINDGEGNFTPKETIRNHFPYTCIEVADFDGDGIDGLVSIGNVAARLPVGLCRNQQHKHLNPFSSVVGSGAFYWADAGDLDDDGDLDLFLAHAGQQPDQVWLNANSPIDKPRPLFIKSEQLIEGGATWNVVAEDFNRDGHTDLFITNEEEAGGALWVNDGNGVFSDSGVRLKQKNGAAAMAADFNADGNVDLFINGREAPDRVWLNQGNGTFQVTDQQLGNGWSQGLVIGDFDNDLDQDVCVSAFLGNSQIWLNDGNGHFEQGQNFPTSVCNGLTSADMDGDGTDDLIISTRTSRDHIEIWSHRHDATFAESMLKVKYSGTGLLAAGDFDGNGSMDVFVGGYHSNCPKVLLCKEKSNFKATELELCSLDAIDVEIGDVDLDGDDDVVIGTFKGQPNQVLVNDGSGHLTLRQWLGNSHGNLTLVDLDHDGDLDLIEPDYVGSLISSASKVSRCNIWINQTVGLRD